MSLSRFLAWTLLLVTAVSASTHPRLAQAQTPTGPVSATRGPKGPPMYFPGTEDGIRSALDTLRTTGGTVFLDRGDYRIAKSLVVWDGITLMGAGEQTRLLAVGEPTSSIRLLRVGSNCRVLSLALIGTGYPRDDWSAHGSRAIAGGTEARGGMNSSSIEDCLFQGWNTTAIDLMANSSHNKILNNRISGSGWEGIYIAQYCDSNLVEENWIDSCRRNAIDVVGSYNMIRRNHVSNVALDSTSLWWDTDGILIYSKVGTTGVVQGNVVEQNSVKAAYNGISVLAGPDSDDLGAIIKGNLIQQCRASGIRVGGRPTSPIQRIRNVQVIGNQVEQCDSSGVFIERVPQRVMIKDNHIYTNRGDGVRVVGDGQVRDITITKNAIISNARRGIFADPPACVSVKSDNVLEGNAEGPNGGASSSAKSKR